MEQLGRNRETSPETDLNGLDGWLFLVGCGLFLQIAISLYYIIGTITIISLIPRSNALTMSIQQHQAGFYFTILFQLALGIFAIYLLTLYFKKRQTFPRAVIIYYLFALFCGLILAAFVVIRLAAYYDVSDPLFRDIATGVVKKTLLFQGVPAAIWIQYMRVSKRVKATFINP